MAYYIGLMSGTSMDGIDGVVLDLDPAARYKVVGHRHEAFEPALRQALFDLNHSGPDEIHRAAIASNALARAYAQTVETLCSQLELPRSSIRAIGAHGQTIRHQPGLHDATGYTCQLLNGALLAELTGFDVVCDFRSRDVAAGGQGAPLVPAFHRVVFGHPSQDIAVLNVGGIANITFLHANGHTAGHDCGPGNVLLDAWCTEHRGQPFDRDGGWAAQGRPVPALLDALLDDPYLRRLPPKSTGRDLFNRAWLQQRLESIVGGTGIRPVDIQTTLSQFTARTVADAVQLHMPRAVRLLVCGGGALNVHLMDQFAVHMPATAVLPIQSASAMDPMQVEAAAFAWLAWAYAARQPGNCIEVTGAAGARVLGAMHRA